MFRPSVRAFGRAQEAQAVEHDEQARAHIGKHGHPHRGRPQKSEHQKNALDAERQGNFCHSTECVRRDKRIVSGIRRRSSFMITMSAASIAVSVPAAPMAIPMSA